MAEMTLSERQLDLIRQIRSWLDDLDIDLEALRREQREVGEVNMGPLGREFVRALGAAGWISYGWPVEYGGQGGGPLEQWAIMEEFNAQGLPYPRQSIAVGRAICAFGTPEQQFYVDEIARGEMIFAIGYSEPDAGSDLAALRTRAVRDGDEYVISGTKLYTSGAHYCTHVWLAARTGTAESRHRGLSIFIVPVDAPGLTVRPLWTQAGERTNECHYEDVRVPAIARIGEDNDGWSLITRALNAERQRIHTTVFGCYRAMVRAALQNTDGGKLADIDAARVGRYFAAASTARVLSARTSWELGNPNPNASYASMAKVFHSELQQQVLQEQLREYRDQTWDIGGDSDEADEAWRLTLETPVHRFALGSTEMQLDLVARYLGLSKSLG